MVNIVARRVPGTLVVNEIAGKLSSDISFTNIFYVDKDIQLVITNLHLNWQPWELLNKKFSINELTAEGVRINLAQKKPAKPDGQSSPSYALIKYLLLKRMDLKNFTLTQENNPVTHIDELALIRLADASNAIFFKSNFGQAKGTLSYNVEPNFSWNLKIKGNDFNVGKIYSNLNSRINFLLDSQGVWTERNKKIELHLSKVNGEFKNFPLNGFVSVRYDNGAIEIDESKIEIANSQVKVSGDVKKDWNLQWEINIAELNNIISNGRGSFSSSGNIIGPEKRPQVQANINAAQLVIADFKIDKMIGSVSSKLKSAAKTLLNLEAKNVNINNYIIPSLRFKLDSEFKKHELISNLTLALSEANQMQGQIVLPNFTSITNLSQPIAGKITFDFKKLNELLTKIPEVKDLQGSIHGSIGISGRLNHPTYAINGTLQNGHLFISKLGIALKEIRLRANYDVNQLINVEGSFLSGSGKGILRGTVDVNAADLATQLKLEGNNLQIMNLPEYKVNISPDLTLDYKNQISIQGTVAIPYANIAPKDFSNVITLPSEVVFVQKEKPVESAAPTNLALHIQLVLGDKINLSYENLHAALGGKLIISQNIGSPATATGELFAIKGDYQAYGKTLTIKEGRFIYAGNILTNPGLDIRAIKKIETVGLAGQTSLYNSNDQLKPIRTGTEIITVGVWVKGTLNKPEINLFSEPAGLSKNDIISYLVFGYPQSQITKGSSLALLNSMASSFNVGSNNVSGKADKIKKKLGLSELNVGSTEVFDPKSKNFTTNATTFTVGKKVGNNLYLRYSVGLFDSVQILSLKYQLTKRLSIQTETSTFNNNTDNGADVLYEFETD